MTSTDIGILVEIGKATVGRAFPTDDKGVSICLLADECSRHAMHSEALSLIESALETARTATNPIVHASGLIAVAGSLCNLGKTKRALEISIKASKILHSQADLLTFLPKTALAILYMNLNHEDEARQLASHIIPWRDGNLDVLTDLQVACAFRIYVYMKAFSEAKQVLLTISQIGLEVALRSAVYDLSKGKDKDCSQKRAGQIEQMSANQPIVLASLMYWYAQNGISEFANKVWTHLKCLLEMAVHGPAKLEAMAIASLALRKMKRTMESNLVAQQAISCVGHVNMKELQTGTLVYVARMYVACGSLSCALDLNSDRVDTPIQGVMVEIVSQLVEDNNFQLAMDAIENCNSAIKDRLIFACVLEMLRNNFTCSVGSAVERLKYIALTHKRKRGGS